MREEGTRPSELVGDGWCESESKPRGLEIREFSSTEGLEEAPDGKVGRGYRRES